MKSADLLKELIAAGCVLQRHNGGSHQIWWSPITGENLPRTASKERFTSGNGQINQKNGGDLIPADYGGNYVFLCRG